MVVLKGIPELLSPELLYAMARMGHGDEIVLAGVNFPTSSVCRSGPQEIRADGLSTLEVLEAMMQLLPLDTYVDNPAMFMAVDPRDDEDVGPHSPLLMKYQNIITDHGNVCRLAMVEKTAFYERAKKAFAVVATGDLSFYGNLILRKGVLMPRVPPGLW